MSPAERATFARSVAAEYRRDGCDRLAAAAEAYAEIIERHPPARWWVRCYGPSRLSPLFFRGPYIEAPIEGCRTEECARIGTVSAAAFRRSACPR